MSIKGKHIVLGAGILVGTGFLFKMAATASNLETFYRLGGVTFDRNKIVLRLDVQVKNPTSTGLRIKYPYVRILSGETVLTTSQSQDEDIHIPAWGQVWIEDIVFEIDLLTAIVLATQITKLLTGKIAEIILKADVRTHAWFGPIGKPYRYEHEMKLTLNDIRNGSR